jgi:hypothetical protein
MKNRNHHYLFFQEFIKLVLKEELGKTKSRAFRGYGASHSYNTRSDKPLLGNDDPFDADFEDEEDTSKIKTSKALKEFKLLERKFKSKYSEDVDYNKNPEKYHITRSSQGVYTAEPYKSDLLPLFKFSSPRESKLSAERIYSKFIDYRDESDFTGMDMARKYLQLGYNITSRFSKYASGKRANKRGTGDNGMRVSKKFFKTALKQTLKDPEYADYLGL